MPESLRLISSGETVAGSELECAALPVTALPLDPISRLRSWEDPAKLRARRRLHNASILSAARAVHASADSARGLFWTINERASRWMFAQASTDDLIAIGDALARLLTVADAFERLEGAGS